LPVEFTEEDIAYQLSLLQSEYGGAEEMIEEEELDMSTKRQIFISLLEEKEINPFNTWESEMPKMVQDPRYSMVKNTKQRMEIFADWARARIALIKEEKAQEKKEDVTSPPRGVRCKDYTNSSLKLDIYDFWRRREMSKNIGLSFEESIAKHRNLNTMGRRN
jgi:transcription elongation regulator 1